MGTAAERVRVSPLGQGSGVQWCLHHNLPIRHDRRDCSAFIQLPKGESTLNDQGQGAECAQCLKRDAEGYRRTVQGSSRRSAADKRSERVIEGAEGKRWTRSLRQLTWSPSATSTSRGSGGGADGVSSFTSSKPQPPSSGSAFEHISRTFWQGRIRLSRQRKGRGVCGGQADLYPGEVDVVRGT